LGISIIFPAFVNEYKGTEALVFALYKNEFNNMLAQASDLLGTELNDFDFQKNNFLENELKSQYISYIFSCAVADILKNQRVTPDFISGYSMGLYSALYYCESVSFAGGLMLIKNAWETISAFTNHGIYGMGMIIGLNEPDITKIIGDDHAMEICNQNNPYTFVITGFRDAVQRVLVSAKAEGALRTNVLPVSMPYHSHFLKSTAQSFSGKMHDNLFKPPVYRYISSLNQRIIQTAKDCKGEVVSNLATRMNWYATMKFHVNQGSKLIFECGAGDGLTRNARFINGNFQAIAVTKLEKFLLLAGR
jgi:malonyl CoA-acyl carrier protein transacylase